jgi:ABC-2 type transport system ATP-binding protein
MRELLRQLAGLGKAVLVSSHILPELADVCDTVGILNSGKMVACGPVQEIMRTVRQKRLIQIEVLNAAAQARQVLASAPGEWQPVEIESANGTLRFDVQATEQQLADALQMLLAEKVQVLSFHEVPADLEDVFMSLTK